MAPEGKPLESSEERTQTTRKGLEIPVPTEADVFRDLRKAAGVPPQPEQSDADGEQG